MIYRILADVVIILHLLFILFVLLGGLGAIWRKWFVAIHVPAVVWAALIEFKGFICPLTPLEKWLRQASGDSGYTTGFVEHYIIPLIYPPGLTSEVQVILGSIVIGLNLGVYSFVLYHCFKKRER